MKELDLEGLRRWQAWLKADAGSGARRAHQYSRLPDMWEGKDHVAADGSRAADAVGELQAHHDKFKELWDARSGDGPPGRLVDHGAWGGVRALGRMSVDRIREASMSFSPGTASTFDGFHPRHFSLLEDKGLEMVAALLEAVEELGELPDGLDAMMIALLPKKGGAGVRPIGLFPALYRLWVRARRREAVEWEGRHARDYFAASAGRGALDAVWRQAAEAEAAAGALDQAAAVLWDLEAFYERFNYDLLVQRARESGFPLTLLRVALAAYRGARFVTQCGRAAPALFASRGVVAGCGFATTLVKVYCLEPLDGFARGRPAVALDAYIDDFTMSARGGRAEVLAGLQAAAEDMQQVVVAQLKGKIAVGKAAAASDDHTLEGLQQRLGVLAGPPGARVATNLGVDFGCGRSRKACGAKTVRRGRAGALPGSARHFRGVLR